MPICRGGCAGVWSSAPTVASRTPIPVHATLRAFIERLLIPSEPDPAPRCEGPGRRSWVESADARAAADRASSPICGCRAAFLARRPISSLIVVMRCRMGARAAADCPSSAIVKKRTASGRRSICWCASPSSRASRARPAAVRPTFVNDRLRARIGWTASIASAGFPAASSARNSGTLQPGAGGIDRDGRAQQVDASRRVGRALRGGQPRRHEHRSIGRGRRQVGHARAASRFPFAAGGQALRPPTQTRAPLRRERRSAPSATRRSARDGRARRRDRGPRRSRLERARCAPSASHGTACTRARRNSSASAGRFSRSSSAPDAARWSNGSPTTSVSRRRSSSAAGTLPCCTRISASPRKTGGASSSRSSWRV